MSNGKEFQRTDAAAGNERRPTVDRRKGETWSSCVDDDRSRRPPGRSATRTSWLKCGGARSDSTRNAKQIHFLTYLQGLRQQLWKVRSKWVFKQKFTQLVPVIRSYMHLSVSHEYGYGMV